MATLARLRQKNARRVDAKARQLAPRVEAWIQRKIKQVFAEAKRKKYKIRKAATDPTDEELLKILMSFGVRNQFGDLEIELTLLNEIIESKKVKIKNISANIRASVVKEINKVMAEAQREKPVPSLAEISRRLKVSLSEMVDMSAGRAALIAHTEAVQNENTAAFERIKISGSKEMMWLAYEDGRSGDRHHEKLNGARRSVEDLQGDDPKKWFKTWLGSYLRFPGDPEGAIKDTANCRCSIVSADYVD